MIRPATREPDPVRDRGGIDIGFLECCRRAGSATGQQEGSPSEGRAPPREGAPDGRIIPEPERAWGPNGPSAPAEWPAGRNGTKSGDNAAVHPGPLSPPVRAPSRAALAIVAGRASRHGSRWPTASGVPRRARGGLVPVRLVVRPARLAARDRRAAPVAVRRSGRSRREHPGHPVARRRTVSWTLGVLAILVALDSGIERYDTTLFSVHMVQHLILTLVAPPLLLFAGPITLLLQASSPETRQAMDPAGAPLAGPAGAVVPGRRVDPVRGGDVGQPLLAAVRPRRSRTSGSTAWSTRCSWAPRCCSGGRSWGRTRRRGG